MECCARGSVDRARRDFKSAVPRSCIIKQNGTGRADGQEETMAYVSKADMNAESTGWYAGLAPIEKRTFWACFGGWTLDAMDVMTFSLVIPAVIVAFNLTNADAGL